MRNTRTSLINTKYWRGTPKYARKTQDEVETPDLDSAKYKSFCRRMKNRKVK